MKKYFIKTANKINWRLLLIHFIATFFFILSVKQFTPLSDIELIELIDKYGVKDGVSHLNDTDIFSGRIEHLFYMLLMSEPIGLLLGFAVSLTIVLRKKIYWLNAVIVALATYVLIRLGFYNLNIFKTIFFSFGRLTTPLISLKIKLITNGVLLLFFGLFILFNKWTNKYISVLKDKSHFE
jgi:hypothetical protein